MRSYKPILEFYDEAARSSGRANKPSLYRHAKFVRVFQCSVPAPTSNLLVIVKAGGAAFVELWVPHPSRFREGAGFEFPGEIQTQ